MVNIYICSRKGRSGWGAGGNNGHLQKSFTIAFNFKLNYPANCNVVADYDDDDGNAKCDDDDDHFHE